jgi:hypothetical protein
MPWSTSRWIVLSAWLASLIKLHKLQGQSFNKNIEKGCNASVCRQSSTSRCRIWLSRHARRTHIGKYELTDHVNVTAPSVDRTPAWRCKDFTFGSGVAWDLPNSLGRCGDELGGWQIFIHSCSGRFIALVDFSVMPVWSFTMAPSSGIWWFLGPCDGHPWWPAEVEAESGVVSSNKLAC